MFGRTLKPGSALVWSSLGTSSEAGRGDSAVRADRGRVTARDKAIPSALRPFTVSLKAL